MRAVLLLAFALLARSVFALDEKAPAPKPGALCNPKQKDEAVKNGDFSATETDGTPEHWKAAYPTGTIAVVKEGAESFLRVEVKGDPANAGAMQIVPVPPGAGSAVLRGRMRGKPGKTPKAAAQLVFWPRGAANAQFPPVIVTSEHSVAWKTEIRTIPILPTMKSIEVSARCVFATGKFDFDDIEVLFK
jgi:hypothetical protein